MCNFSSYTEMIKQFPMSPYPYKYAAFSEGKPRKLQFRQVLAYWLDEAGWSAHKLAKECTELAVKKNWQAKVTEADLYAYLKGRCSPKIDKLSLLSEVTELPFDLITGYKLPSEQSSGMAITRRVA